MDSLRAYTSYTGITLNTISSYNTAKLSLMIISMSIYWSSFINKNIKTTTIGSDLTHTLYRYTGW